MKFKSLIVAAAFAIAAPIAAFAATLAPSNNLSDQPLQFDVSYVAGTAGQTLDFVIVNDTGVGAVIGISAGTVNQFSASFSSLNAAGDGVILTWLDSGNSQSVASAPTDVFGSTLSFDPAQAKSNFIVAGGSATLRLQFGAVVDGVSPGTGSGNIDFTVIATPVPVPAGLLLMGTALAGFGVMQRRKKKQAA